MFSHPTIAVRGDIAVDKVNVQCGAMPPNPPPPPLPPPKACDNTCPSYPSYVYDYYCDDGGPGAQYSFCEYGSDCWVSGGCHTSRLGSPGVITCAAAE